MIATIFQDSSLKDHSFTCILSHVDRSGTVPHGSARQEPRSGSPKPSGSRLRDPASPKRGLSRFGVSRADGLSDASTAHGGRGVLRSRPHAAGRRLGRGLLEGDARRPGWSAARSRAKSLLFRLFNTVGETLPSMALARQAAVLAKGQSQVAVQAAAAAGRGRSGRHGAAAGRAAVRRAPRRRPADRDGHHHAVRPGQAARRSARSRRRRRHAIRRQRRRHLRRHASSGRSCGAPASWPPCATGPTEHEHRPGRQLRLQRQRVRHAAAGRGRPSRSWSTPTRGWC